MFCASNLWNYLMTTQKPLLILNCSDLKLQGKHAAYDLYQGAIYSLINKNCNDIRNFADVLILSAKHGLITADTEIEYYNQRMPTAGTKEMSDFIEKHKKAAVSLLKEKLTKGRDCYVCMTLDYQHAFDSITDTGFKSRFKHLNYLYVSRNCGGIGYMRGRVKGIVNAIVNKCQVKPVIFRSGVANADESIGYLSAGCNIGSSLAYFDTKPFLPFFIANSLKTQYSFIDNGVITAMKKGETITPVDVFANYKNIIDKLTDEQASRLSIVIPDDMLFPSKSLKVVTEHANAIRELADRCQVMLVVHKCVDIAKHAKNMLEALNYHPNLTLGVPSRLGIETGIKGLEKINPRLSLPDIERLLEMKVKIDSKGKNKRPVWRRVHFLGLCEKSGQAYTDRLNLAAQHGFMTPHFDTCRTPALIGNEKTSNLQGTKLLRLSKNIIEHNKTVADLPFVDHDIESEWDEPVIYDAMNDLLNQSVALYLHSWNDIFKGTGLAFTTYEVASFLAMDESESVNELSDMLCRIDGDYLTKMAKPYFWMKFCERKHEATSIEKRISALCKSMIGEREPVPVTLPVEFNHHLPKPLQNMPFYLPKLNYELSIQY